VQQPDSLTVELEQSRAELLELAAKVQRLIGKRSEREALLQRLHRSAAMPTGIRPAMPSHHLCSLCATDYASLPIQNVRGVTPGTKCDHCGQPAIVWIQLKREEESEAVPAA
jgi:hypothetical protein